MTTDRVALGRQYIRDAALLRQIEAGLQLSPAKQSAMATARVALRSVARDLLTTGERWPWGWQEAIAGFHRAEIRRGLGLAP